jgi:hypothetical protein
MMASIPGMLEYQDNSYKTLHQHRIDPEVLPYFLLGLAGDGLVKQNQINPLVQEFKAPRYMEFRNLSMWSVYNNITTVLQGTDMLNLWNGTEAIFQRCLSHRS